LRFTASVVDEQFLLRLQDGREFIARRRGTGGQFHSDDLVNGWGYGRAPWFGAFREALAREPKACNDDELLATMDPVRTSPAPSA